MLNQIGRRLATVIPSLIGVIIVTFLLTRVLPGDTAAYFAGPAASAQAIEEVRKQLGLDARQLAYRHMNFLTPAGRHAGLQANDVIVGLDDQTPTMTARQFEMHIRLHYRVGQEITFNVLRGKERVSVRLKLPE